MNLGGEANRILTWEHYLLRPYTVPVHSLLLFYGNFVKVKTSQTIKISN